jgi:predicted lipoprotein
MNRLALILALTALAAGAVWRFPLFRVVPLEQINDARRAAAFDAPTFAKEFWTTRLPTVFDQASDAATVVAALRDDLAQAREKYGRQVGVSRTAYYVLRGSGTIASVDKQGVRVSLAGNAPSPEILLVTGPVFGNAVRDATGLLPTRDFPNSQHFNELASELNRLAEQGPIRVLKERAKPGAAVTFIGCSAVTTAADIAPLKIIPVDVTIE